MSRLTEELLSGLALFTGAAFSGVLIALTPLPAAPSGVILSGDVSAALNEAWERGESLRSEQVLCLHGRVVDGVVRVSGTSTPHIIEQSRVMARFDVTRCEKRGDFVGTAHTHPAIAPCRPGPIDPDLAVTMPGKLHLAVCGPGRAVRVDTGEPVRI